MNNEIYAAFAAKGFERWHVDREGTLITVVRDEDTDGNGRAQTLVRLDKRNNRWRISVDILKHLEGSCWMLVGDYQRVFTVLYGKPPKQLAAFVAARLGDRPGKQAPWESVVRIAMRQQIPAE